VAQKVMCGGYYVIILRNTIEPFQWSTDVRAPPVIAKFQTPSNLLWCYYVWQNNRRM